MIKPLTSLRFVFALLVFLSHYTISGEPIFSEGYIGVSFFFILSGFVLAYSYNDKLTSGSVSAKDFYVARLARIYPLHILTFVVALILLVSTGNTIELWPTISNITLTQSWIPDQSYYFSYNAPSWSISDEMFFYLVFPLIIYLANKLSRSVKFITITAVTLIFFCTLYFLIKAPEEVTHATFYINPLFRLIDFLIGIGLYFLWRKGINSNQDKARSLSVLQSTSLEVASITLLVVMILFSYDFSQTIRYSIYYWLPMAIVIYVFSISHFAKGYLSRFLSLKWCVILGEVSFAFYMIHTLVIRITDSCFKYVSNNFEISLPEVLKLIITFVIILLGSIISFYWFETPVNKWIKNTYAKNKDKIAL